MKAKTSFIAILLASVPCLAQTPKTPDSDWNSRFQPRMQGGPTATPAASEMPKEIAALKEDLVVLDGKTVKPLDSSKLNGKKYVAYYYSASWCGPCRRFTPDLVKFYKRKNIDQSPLEVVFVSADRSEDAMVEYMKTDDMPWPALGYTKTKDSHPARKYAGPGIPCLVLVDGTGKVLSDSFVNGKYVGPSKVMEDIAKVLEGKPL